MNERLSDSQASREALSALADGQAQASDVSRACAAWREDADARASWQAYHLIGDVMRSDDLAQGSGSADFLAKFRDRLAQEPVVLAPASAQAVAAQPVVAPAPTNVVALKRRTWAGPMAVAASFVMVVGAVVTLQMGSLFGGNALDNGQLAQSSTAGRASVVVPAPVDSNTSITLASSNSNELSAGVPAPSASNVSVEGASFNRPDGAGPIFIRDPQLDQLLASMPRHAGGGDTTFASQGGLARATVTEAP